MPGKIHPKKQMKFLEAAAHGGLTKSSGGPSPQVASKMLSHESHSTKSRLMKGK